MWIPATSVRIKAPVLRQMPMLWKKPRTHSTQTGFGRHIEMSNEDRIYRLCELITDLINILPEANSHLDWVRNEVREIMNDIDKEWASGGA